MLPVCEILAFLECRPGPPEIHLLSRLVRAYPRKVPWESVFRITRRTATPKLGQRPRWPEVFWEEAIQSGAGGTCFESNYAFFALLQVLGYMGYLTINDMGERRGCHSAIVIRLGGRKYLVDVGIPLLAVMPINAERTTHRTTWLHTYTLRPDGSNRYRVLRSRHPKPEIYTLLDSPVSEPDYRRVVEQDYGENGLFLDRVIVAKIIGERLWRFSSAELPYRLEWFSQADRGEVPIPPGQAAPVLSEQFQMEEGKIREAFQALETA